MNNEKFHGMYENDAISRELHRIREQKRNTHDAERSRQNMINRYQRRNREEKNENYRNPTNNE